MPRQGRCHPQACVRGHRATSAPSGACGARCPPLLRLMLFPLSKGLPTAVWVEWRSSQGRRLASHLPTLARQRCVCGVAVVVPPISAGAAAVAQDRLRRLPVQSTPLQELALQEAGSESAKAPWMRGAPVFRRLVLKRQTWMRPRRQRCAPSPPYSVSSSRSSEAAVATQMQLRPRLCVAWVRPREVTSPEQLRRPRLPTRRCLPPRRRLRPCLRLRLRPSLESLRPPRLESPRARRLPPKRRRSRAR